MHGLVEAAKWSGTADDGFGAAVQRAVARTLLNAGFDATTGLELAIATTVDQLRVFDMEAKERVIHARNTDGPYRHFVLPAVEPWTMRLVVLRRP